MSCFDVQILDPNINTIEIQTCIGDQPSSIDILTYDNTSIVEINHCVPLLSEIVDILPVQDILAGSGISVSDNSGIYTVSLLDPTININDIVGFLEGVQDIIGQSGLIAGNYISINYDDNTGFTTVSSTGLQPSGNYSVDGHTHTSSNITDFNSSVSGLLPVKNINAGSGIGISSVSGDFIVSVTGTFGLTSEEVDDRISNLLVAGNYINLNYNDFGNSLTISVTGVQPSGNYSLVGHSHNTSDITNFDSGVSGLLPSVSGSGYIVSSFTNNIYTISVTGLQPSGNYSVVGHTHLSSDITNFDSAVSGLIPPSNFTSLTGISGIVVTNSGTNYFVGLNDPTIQLADITDLTPAAQTFLLTSSSTNLSSLMIDKTGSGVLVFNTSPAFSGIPTVPTASSGTNTDQIASTAFVRNEISNLVDSAPITLDTLNELAAALGDDPNFATTITNSLAGKANLSGAIFTGSVTIPSGTGNFNSLTVNGTGVSVSGHTHSYTDIINFASGIDQEVSTLLVGGSYINLNYNNIAGTLTISATGLQPSGSYASGVHSHGNISSSGTIGSTSGLLITTTTGGALTTSSGISSNYITNFNSSVSGLLPSVTGTGYVSSSFSNNAYTISVSGLQPSGNYSVDGHTHSFLEYSEGSFERFDVLNGGLLGQTQNSNDGFIGITTYDLSEPPEQNGYCIIGSRNGDGFIQSNIIRIEKNGGGLGYLVADSGNFISGLTVNDISVSLDGHTHSSVDITDFNSSVSGLLPVTDIIGGANIAVTNSGSIYTINVSGQLGLTAEQVDDRVSNLLVAGNYITLNYNDNNNTLTINTSGLQPSGFYASGVHYHSSADITNFNSSVSGLLFPYALLDSPSFTGTPTVPTANSGTNTTQIASTAFVRTEISNLVNSAPATLDTLNELAAALGDDPNFATTIASGLSQKSNIGHTHVSSDITNFNSSVSGLLPVKDIISGSGINIINNTGLYTINIANSGVTTQKLADDSVTADKIAPNQTVQFGGIIVSDGYSLSKIVNLRDTGFIMSNESGILQTPSYYFSISPYGIVEDGIWNATPISVEYGGTNSTTPSGARANLGLSYGSVSGTVCQGDDPRLSDARVPLSHYHLSSDITNFNSSVSGLLPVKNILSGTGVSVSNTSGIFTINATGSGIAADQAKALVTTVFNKTGSPIPKMTAVYINGGQGDLPTVSLAIATSDMTSAGTYGLTYEAIPNMQSGLVIVFGALTGLDTDQFNPTAPTGNVNGSVIYLSPSVSGALTLTKPSAPNHIVAIGTIIRTHQNEGIIEVRVQNGFELEELHNVAISGASNGQFLQYNSTSGLWVPSSSGNFSTLQVNGTGVSLIGHTHTSSNITDFNSSVSGLLPSITGTGYVNTSFSSNIYTISVTGLQPSGNYANAIHTHSSSEITDFNSSVSGLLPTISNSGDNRLLTSTGSSVGINAENNLTFDGSTLNVDGNLVFDSFTESVVAVGNSSTSQTISLTSGTVQTCTLTNNCTFTMPTTTAGKSFTMFLNSGSGNYTASFSGVLWSDSAPPTITTTASKVDILSFISDGTYWYGSYSQNYG